MYRVLPISRLFSSILEIVVLLSGNKQNLAVIDCVAALYGLVRLERVRINDFLVTIDVSEIQGKRFFSNRLISSKLI
jgi:hypothetical protein